MNEMPILGEDEELRELTTSSEHRDTALAMIGQGTRYLYIFTRDLDPVVFDDENIYEACSTLARYAPQSHVRILVQDSRRAAREGHRLVRLAQRLSSKVEIRKPHHEFARYNAAFLTVDNTGYIYQPLADRYEGNACFHEPARARELNKFFHEVWEKSQTDPQLRRLYV